MEVSACLREAAPAKAGIRRSVLKKHGGGEPSHGLYPFVTTLPYYGIHQTSANIATRCGGRPQSCRGRIRTCVLGSKGPCPTPRRPGSVTDDEPRNRKSSRVYRKERKYSSARLDPQISPDRKKTGEHRENHRNEQLQADDCHEVHLQVPDKIDIIPGEKAVEIRRTDANKKDENKKT